MRLCWGRLKIPPPKKSGAKKVVSRYPKHLISSHFSLRGRFFEKNAKKNSRRASAGTESRPAAQTLGTVRMLSGLRSWTRTNSLKLLGPCLLERLLYLHWKRQGNPMHRCLWCWQGWRRSAWATSAYGSSATRHERLRRQARKKHGCLWR